MIFTNLLFACLGVAFIAFGLIGMEDKFLGATLFPDNTFKRKRLLLRFEYFYSHIYSLSYPWRCHLCGRYFWCHWRLR